MDYRYRFRFVFVPIFTILTKSPMITYLIIVRVTLNMFTRITIIDNYTKIILFCRCINVSQLQLMFDCVGVVLSSSTSSLVRYSSIRSS